MARKVYYGVCPAAAGGAINGATVYLEYTVAGVYYTWSTLFNTNTNYRKMT